MNQGSQPLHHSRFPSSPEYLGSQFRDVHQLWMCKNRVFSCSGSQYNCQYKSIKVYVVTLNTFSWDHNTWLMGKWCFMVAQPSPCAKEVILINLFMTPCYSTYTTRYGWNWRAKWLVCRDIVSDSTEDHWCPTCWDWSWRSYRRCILLSLTKIWSRYGVTHIANKPQ